MSEYTLDLYKLLPYIYKLKDEEIGRKLHALMDIISDQVDIIKYDIDGLWDDFFIETCDPWIVSYIADLVGTTPLHTVDESIRGDVANTIYYRRSKGTVSMLEGLAKDVTGWPDHVVPFMELLGWTQNLNHLRYKRMSDPRREEPYAVDCIGSINLKDIDSLNRLDGPFDIGSHTADIRKMDQLHGWYGIRNIGFFFWRLRNYPLGEIGDRSINQKDDLIKPRRSKSEGCFHFSTLGAPSQLFNKPQVPATRTSDEINVPGPISQLSFSIHPDQYYGQDKSFLIIRDGIPVPRAAIISTDLSEWDRPPATAARKVRCLLSGVLPSEMNLTSDTLELSVDIGAEGARNAVLPYKPADNFEAGILLEAAIRKAHTSCAYASARVAFFDNRFVICAGTGIDTISISSTPEDPFTASELRLDSTHAEQLNGTLSGRLKPFPEMTMLEPEMKMTIGIEGSKIVKLASKPSGIKEAVELLMAAIKGDGTIPCFAASNVVLLKDQLLVITKGEAPVFEGSDHDGTSFLEMELGGRKVAVDVRLGRIAFAKEWDNGDVGVYYNRGFSANMGGGPYDRRKTLMAYEKDADKEDFTREISSSDLQKAIENWSNSSETKGEILITDNAVSEGSLSIDMHEGRSLVIRADNRKCPLISPPGEGIIEVKGVKGSSLTLDGLLIEGSIRIIGGLDELIIRHSALVPGIHLDEEGLSLEPWRPSLIVEAADNRLNLKIDHSILGAMRLPEEMEKLSINDSIIDCALQERIKAEIVPALISDTIDSIPDLGQEELQVKVKIGNEGPFIAVLPNKPVSLSEAALLLQEAIRKSHDSPAFRDMRVIETRKKLLFLPGTKETVIINETESDKITAKVFNLLKSSSMQVLALLTVDNPDPSGVSSDSPRMMVLAGSLHPHEIVLEPAPKSLTEAGERLEKALNAIDDPDLKEAIVTVFDGGMAVIPGTPNSSIFFCESIGDRSTVRELALQSDWPAIASNKDLREPGPNLSLERSTIFGTVNSKSVGLISNSIITGTVTTKRIQSGCVRFSYIPEFSRTPRRYRCQPDMTLEKMAKKLSKKSSNDLSEEEKQRVFEAIRPAFTSELYENPAYSQLSINCAVEIRTGAEDDSEMGAFSSLKQPQREANLRIRLEEYLPFGLDFGIIFVT